MKQSRFPGDRNMAPKLTALPLLVFVLSGPSCANTSLAQNNIATTQSEIVKIVGIGAVKCHEFATQIVNNPSADNEYIAWAQGFMSGALVRAPSGVDTGLDLLPQDFGTLRQKEYIKDFCLQNPQSDFSDAVISLYRTLRTILRTR